MFPFFGLTYTNELSFRNFIVDNLCKTPEIINKYKIRKISCNSSLKETCNSSIPLVKGEARLEHKYNAKLLLKMKPSAGKN